MRCIHCSANRLCMNYIWTMYGFIWIVCTVCVLYASLWTVYALHIDGRNCMAQASGAAPCSPAWGVYRIVYGLHMHCVCTVYAYGCVWPQAVRTGYASVCIYMDCVRTIFFAIPKTPFKTMGWLLKLSFGLPPCLQTTAMFRCIGPSYWLYDVPALQLYYN